MKSSWIVLLVLALVIGLAPLALAQRAETCGSCMHKGDGAGHAANPHGIMDAVMHLKYHPMQIKALSPERIMWLLGGFKRLAKAPFVDQDALFDLQLKITLHLLDLQVMRLETIFPNPSFGKIGHSVKDHKGETYEPRGAKHHHMHRALITKVEGFDFYSSKGCQRNQAKITRQNSLNRNIFVGPCQTDSHAQWSFNVWKV